MFRFRKLPVKHSTGDTSVLCNNVLNNFIFHICPPGFYGSFRVKSTNILKIGMAMGHHSDMAEIHF